MLTNPNQTLEGGGFWKSRDRLWNLLEKLDRRVEETAEGKAPRYGQVGHG